MEVRPHTVHKVGPIDDPAARVVRVVHISDTHMTHNDLISSIPPGDILIHSGDFSNYHWTRHFNCCDHKTILREANKFFGKLPHKHKIFVAGNHELGFHQYEQSYLARLLPNAIYLQDATVTLEGLRIYGTPWTHRRQSSSASGYTLEWEELGKRWDAIPSDTDLLVTHMPPMCIMDLSGSARRGEKVTCRVCGQKHGRASHLGCQHLRDTVLKRVRPALHLFGHMHVCHGVEIIDGVTFSNGAMMAYPEANVFDFYISTPAMCMSTDIDISVPTDMYPDHDRHNS